MRKSPEDLIDVDPFKKLVVRMYGVNSRSVVDLKQLLPPGPEERLLVANTERLHTCFARALGLTSVTGKLLLSHKLVEHTRRVR